MWPVVGDLWYWRFYFLIRSLSVSRRAIVAFLKRITRMSQRYTLAEDFQLVQFLLLLCIVIESTPNGTDGCHGEITFV